MEPALQDTERDRAGFDWSLAVLLAVGLAIRLEFLFVKPAGALSLDARAWEYIARLIAGGQNPYIVDVHLAWPPLWMICIFAIQRAANLLGASFFTTLFCFLILVETCAIAATYSLLRRFVSRAAARDALLVGIALNPAAIFQVTQHGNFDVIVGLCVVMAIRALIAFDDRRETVDWLSACAWLGIGVLTKTIPLLLAPLLAQHAAKLPRRTLWLGALLLLGPAALGTGVIFVLAPDAVWQKVLLYRSVPGYFGISGLLGGATAVMNLYAKLFTLLVLAVMVLTTSKMWRGAWRFNPQTIVLAAAIALLAMPTLGPGFGTQYLCWHLPLFVCVYAFSTRAWKRLLLTALAIVVLTYLLAYLFFESHGALLPQLLPERQALWRMSEYFIDPFHQTLALLPLFVVSSIVTIAGCVAIRRTIRDRSRPVE